MQTEIHERLLARITVPPALLDKLHDARVSPAWELRGGDGGGGGGGSCRGALSLTRRAHAAFLPCSLGAASRLPARNRRPSVLESEITTVLEPNRRVSVSRPGWCNCNFSPATEDRIGE